MRRNLLWSSMLLPSLALPQVWSPLPDFPGTARDDAAAFVIGNDIYVGTGRQVDFGLTADWYRYNTITGSWSEVAALPADGRQYCSSFTWDGKGYLVGGHVNGMPSAEVWTYDPVLDAWEQQGPLPEAMHASTAFVLDDGPHVVTGYLSNDLPSTYHVRSDMASGSWSTLANMPGAPRHRASSFAYGGAGYVLGGADVTSYEFDEVWRFDPMEGTWVARAPLPSGRFRGDAIEAADGGVLIGGASVQFVPTGVHDDVWHYHAASDTWEVLPPFPPGARSNAVIATVNGSIYYGTGSNAVERYRDWWRLDLPVSVHEQDVDLPAPYPNPTSGTLRLEGSLLPSDRKVILMDGNGRAIREWPVSHTSVDLDGVSPGVYVLRIEGGTIRRHPLMIIP
ncbi:MAG TPA: hypothetical protein PKN30_09225 [Flavobacteriales bacterium]|nr:hypothetical protein [Flavobacteriales bacterium]